MPIFDTPAPINATVEVVVGDVRLIATDRPDTIVEVRPSNPKADRDVRAAEETRVEFTDGRLLIKAPDQRTLGLFGNPGSIDVEILLPAGSAVRGQASVAAFHSTGRLGECRIKNATGDIHLESTGPLDVTTTSGAIVVRSVTGDATVSGSGEVRLDRVDGDAVLKNLNGDSRIDAVTGDLKARAANGDVIVGLAGSDVTASSANGDVRIREVTTGVISIKTANGELEVGVPSGTAAFLELHTSYGNVRNRLETTAEPGQGERTVEIRARNSYGDIIVRRP